MDNNNTQGSLPISEGFILAIVGSLSACVALIFKFILKSRCSNISLCCGFVNCKREVIPSASINDVELAVSPPTRSRTNRD
jgi:hypothetical protein